MIRTIIALLASTSMLSACYGFRGPQPVLSASGVVAQDHRGQPRSEFFFQRFRDLALEAAGCIAPSVSAAPPTTATDLPRVRCDDRNVADAQRDALMKRYMRAGFALIYADCNEYLAVMARHQGRARIARDLVTPITNLITGILSLRNLSDGENQDWLTRLTIGSSAATAGLDIVDQRFLFGSDNIDSVRELVARALGAQANQAMEGNNFNFELASNQILNNQAMCTPSGILRLTRNAIQNAAVTPTNAQQTGTGETKTNPQNSTSQSQPGRVAPNSVDVPQPQ